MNSGTSETMAFFFRSAGVGIVICALKTDFNTLTLQTIVFKMMLEFQYVILHGLWFAISSMLWYIFLICLKKWFTNEQ